MDYSQKTYLSSLFTSYNIVKSCPFEPGRLNRALGLAMRKNAQDKFDEYNTTEDHCDCPDSEIRQAICKHRIAKYLIRITYLFIQCKWLGDWTSLYEYSQDNYPGSGPLLQ